MLSRLAEQQHDFLRRTIAVDIRIAMSAPHIAVIGVAGIAIGGFAPWQLAIGPAPFLAPGIPETLSPKIEKCEIW